MHDEALRRMRVERQREEQTLERDALNSAPVNSDRTCLFVLIAIWKPFNIYSIDHESRIYVPKVKKVFSGSKRGRTAGDVL